jgi:tRNA A37 threonylcarbamoyltransferase TsaD
MQLDRFRVGDGREQLLSIVGNFAAPAQIETAAPDFVAEDIADGIDGGLARCFQVGRLLSLLVAEEAYRVVQVEIEAGHAPTTRISAEVLLVLTCLYKSGASAALTSERR